MTYRLPLSALVTRRFAPLAFVRVLVPVEASPLQRSRDLEDAVASVLTWSILEFRAAAQQHTRCTNAYMEPAAECSFVRIHQPVRARLRP